LLEEGSERDIDIIGMTDPGDDLSSEEGMTSDFKEVIMDTDLLNFKDFCPDGRKSQFEG
jgi:hypothetical protein